MRDSPVPVTASISTKTNDYDMIHLRIVINLGLQTRATLSPNTLSRERYPDSPQTTRSGPRRSVPLFHRFRVCFVPCHPPMIEKAQAFLCRSHGTRVSNPFQQRHASITCIPKPPYHPLTCTYHRYTQLPLIKGIPRIRRADGCPALIAHQIQSTQRSDISAGSANGYRPCLDYIVRSSVVPIDIVLPLYRTCKRGPTYTIYRTAPSYTVKSHVHIAKNTKKTKGPLDYSPLNPAQVNSCRYRRRISFGHTGRGLLAPVCSDCRHPKHPYPNTQSTARRLSSIYIAEHALTFQINTKERYRERAAKVIQCPIQRTCQLAARSSR